MPLPTTDYVAEPTLILMGCRPWPPEPDPAAPAGCPVCGQGIPAGCNTHYCAVCDGLSPSQEARVRAARIGLKARDASNRAEREYRDDLRRRDLTESERRHIWFGYSKKGYESGKTEVVNRAKVGRDWLTEIGQLPDWSLILDRRGQVVGRYEPAPEPAG
jgi:hypothetical protein